MKAVDFAKLLKEIIRKEVRTVIRQELREALNQNKQPLKKRGTTRTHTDIHSTTHAPVTQQPIHKTGNAALDGILMETANAMKGGQSAPIQEDGGAYQDMAPQFTADQAQGFGHMVQHNDSPDGIPINPNDPTSVFMKDYSGVLKTATDIHNRKHGG
tara:strand:+ start:1448 stop:1918 length:471 start_codon:yes stop_codon:yes gene_type:complete